MGEKAFRGLVILPENLKEDTEEKLCVKHLKHPRTGSTVLCALDSQKKLFEFTNFKEEFSSWFVDDTVIEDGSLHFLTPVDPLFFILPYFNEDGKYCPLEDLIVDESYPDAKYLLDCCASKDILKVADSKESMGIEVYRVNQSKVLNWLKSKTNVVLEALKEKKISISDGSHAVSLNIAHKSEEDDSDMYTGYACHLVAEYLTEGLSKELFQSFGLDMKIPESSPSNNENTQQSKTKKQKTEPVTPLDDYSNKLSSNSASTQKSNLSIAQKKLLKVDKSGMKSISSFFKKK